MGTIQSLELYSKGHTNQNNVLLALQTLIDNLQSINWQLRQLEQETTEMSKLDRSILNKLQD